MDKKEKIYLLQSLLRTLVYLPQESGLWVSDAEDIFDRISEQDDEDKLDTCIVTITETLEKIGFKIQGANSRMDKLILTEEEAFDKHNEIVPMNHLFSNF